MSQSDEKDSKVVPIDTGAKGAAAPDGGQRRRGRPRHGKAVDRNLPRDEELLKIAAEVFFRQGYDGTKLDDIAREAGIVKAPLSLVFASLLTIHAHDLPLRQL